MKTSPGRIAGVFAHHGLDALAHRAQVHRHVRRVGDQVAVGVEEAQLKSSRSLMLTE
jgi:hypothetical protein